MNRIRYIYLNGILAGSLLLFPFFDAQAGEFASQPSTHAEAKATLQEEAQYLSASQLAGILDLIKTSGSLPLILKSGETDRACEVLVQETGAPVCELDTLVSGPDDPPLDYYESVMLENVQSILDANGQG